MANLKRELEEAKEQIAEGDNVIVSLEKVGRIVIVSAVNFVKLLSCFIL